MIRERIADNVYWFQSEIYAQVTAGAIVGPEWAVLVDSLMMPEEVLEMRTFLEEAIGVQVRYIINTIYHADHTFGNCFFPGAAVISHARCREIMQASNFSALESVQEQNPQFKRIKIVLPSITFETGTLTLQVGKRHIRIFSAPGNSPGGIAVFVREDRVLFSGDAFLPLPIVVEGNVNDLTETMKKIGKMSLENIVQGHGDVILRGEIDQAVRSNLNYLTAIQKVVKTAARRKNPLPVLEQATIEECGKNRVLLGGLVEELHKRNLSALYQQEMKSKDSP